jgi:hypothetical protein
MKKTNRKKRAAYEMRERGDRGDRFSFRFIVTL